MLFAAHAAVGAGLAFLLLLALSCMGLAVLVARVPARPTLLRRRAAYLVAAGLLQAWLVYLLARQYAGDFRRAVEWAWLGSLCLVIGSLVVAFLVGRRGSDGWQQGGSFPSPASRQDPWNDWPEGDPVHGQTETPAPLAWGA